MDTDNSGMKAWRGGCEVKGINGEERETFVLLKYIYLRKRAIIILILEVGKLYREVN